MRESDLDKWFCENFGPVPDMEKYHELRKAVSSAKRELSRAEDSLELERIQRYRYTAAKMAFIEADRRGTKDEAQ